MSRPRRPHVLPRQGESLLEGLFRRVGLLDEARAWRAMAAWPLAVGKELAGRTRAERLHGTVLTVRVVSSSWANELAYMKTSLLSKLQATRGGEAVTDLRFSIGPLEGAPLFDEPAQNENAAAAPPLPLPPDDPAIERALSELADPVLREALRQLIQKARTR